MEDPNDPAKPNDDSLLSEFDRHRLLLVSRQNEDEGWQSEMRRYIKEIPRNITKDTDIVKWWEVCMIFLNDIQASN
jgi:hypothetical protein